MAFYLLLCGLMVLAGWRLTERVLDHLEMVAPGRRWKNFLALVLGRPL